MQLNNFEILYSAVALMSFLIFLIHWINNIKTSLPNFLIRVFLLTNCYYYIIAILIDSQGIKLVPFLFRTGSIAGLISTPIIFLIVKKTVKGEPWHNRDYLHFIPVFLYVMDFTSFFILSNESKLKIINNLYTKNFNGILGYNEGWIFNGQFWIICKVSQTLIYSLLGFFSLTRTIQNSNNSFKIDNNKIIVLSYWLTICLFLNAVSVTISFLGFAASIGWDITRIILTSTTLITCLYLFLNPEILYGLKGIWVTTGKNTGSDNLENNIYENQQSEKKDQDLQTINLIASGYEQNNDLNNQKKIYINKIQVKKMEDTLGKYLEESNAYLQPGYSLPQLAKETGFPLQNLSAFLNQHKGEKFNDYINKFRIKYLMILFENDSSYFDQLTLESLSKQAGFGSRSAFISAFKKVTGQTPSEYFRQ
jgi:AraC-like DNA-binding protein